MKIQSLLKVCHATYSKEGLDPQSSNPKTIFNYLHYRLDLDRPKKNKIIPFGVKCAHFGLFLELCKI